ncbi:MAG: type 1 glutamine amidotransferase [Candidatus Omnitrophica bacterium]|nr:type 1 glutamine amidotransferase [Candidatus Omnitrophota bacterium]
MTSLLVIQHVPHERLGTLEEALTASGCEITPLNVYDATARWPSLEAVDALIVMGGPQSVYQQDRHPYLTKELSLLRQALQRRLPVLGICLGAQLLAEALGGTVRAAQQPEIGWYPLMREPGASGDPLFEAFGRTETVFQWHGDTFALPKGAAQLASSPLCPQQAFRYGDRAWGLQFHVEMTEAMIRTWLMKNKAELAALQGRIDPPAIRRQSPAHLPRLQELSRHIASAFCRIVADTARPPARSRAHASPRR